MSRDDTRPTVHVRTSFNPPRDQLMIHVRLPEIVIGQMLDGTGISSETVEETIKQMKIALDQKFYGDARCALHGLRLLASNIAEYSTDRVALRDAINIVEEKLQLRTSLCLTQL